MADSSDLYRPEWLALEQSLGSRPVLSGNQEIDVPVFNQMGEQLSAQWPKIDGLDVVEREIEPENIKVRMYTPQGKRSDLPLIVYFHGGGYLSGSLSTEDPHCRILASKVAAMVVNVDYPLAPETRLDGIIKSGLRAIEWSQSQNLTTSSTLLIAGGSAGASLVIQIAYQYATSSSPSTLSGLIAMFPFCAPVDLYTGPYAEEHKSYNEKATGAPFLTKQVIIGVYDPVQADLSSPAHFPLLAPPEVLAKFPRTYIVTAEHDPCRDDGRILAKRLLSEGDKGVKEDYWEGLPHFFHWFPMLPLAAECMDKCVDGVKWVLEAKQ